MDFEELENTKNNIIDITKARGLRLLGMMQPTGPIDGNISILAVKLDGGADRSAGGGLAEAKKAVENGAVLADVETLEMAGVGVVVEGFGCDGSKEIDVVVGVESSDVVGGGGEGTVDLHPAVEGVVDDEVVGHADTVGFHRVALAIVVVPNCGLIEVCYSTLFSVGP